MSKTKEELIQFRLNKGLEALDIARMSMEKEYWNTAISKLYYTCFYYISALFAKQDIMVSTHTGLISLFSLHFIKEGKIDMKWGKLLRTLFDKRQKGDYGDFMIVTREDVLPIVKEVEEFIIILESLIQEKNS